MAFVVAPVDVPLTLILTPGRGLPSSEAVTRPLMVLTWAITDTLISSRIGKKKRVKVFLIMVGCLGVELLL
ncbi:hypothetical protein D3C86_1793780 [compost metagenome]